MRKSLFVLLVFVSAIFYVQGIEKIDGAFGFKLGEKLDENMIIGTAKLTSGTIIYQVNPSNPFKSFSTYYVLATPKTSIIYQIWAIGDYEKQAAAKNDQALLMSILEGKYGKPEKEGIFDVLDDKKSINQGNRCVTVNIEGFTDIKLEIRYIDIKLSELAEKERIKIEAGKADSSGL